MILQKVFHSIVASLYSPIDSPLHITQEEAYMHYIFLQACFSFSRSSRNEWTEESVYDIPNDPGELPRVAPVFWIQF